MCVESKHCWLLRSFFQINKTSPWSCQVVTCHTRTCYFPIMINFNWSSWAVSARFYAMHCCWLANWTNEQVYRCRSRRFVQKLNKFIFSTYFIFQTSYFQVHNVRSCETTSRLLSQSEHGWIAVQYIMNLFKSSKWIQFFETNESRMWYSCYICVALGQWQVAQNLQSDRERNQPQMTEDNSLTYKRTTYNHSSRCFYYSNITYAGYRRYYTQYVHISKTDN